MRQKTCRDTDIITRYGLNDAHTLVALAYRVLSLGTLINLRAPFCLYVDRLRTFKGFICEGEGVMCLWVHQKQAVTS